MVPWVVDHPDTTINELAERFGVSARDIQADLDLLMMCGLPPYSPDQLIDVFVSDDGHVDIDVGDYFKRPLQLTPAEGVAVLAAGRALLDVPGSDPDGALASGLAKLEEAISARGALDVDVAAPELLDDLRDAAAQHACVRIQYWSHSSRELTTRVIEPQQVFGAFGHWYCAAMCRSANAERLFRIDRIRTSERPGETFVSAASGDEVGAVFHPRLDDLRVDLHLDPDAAWVLEAIPVEHSEALTDGTFRVRLAVSSTAFLERLLIRLGTAARVEGPESARGLGAAAAQRVLTRYE